ncbi:MAG: ferrochelatase [Myxococcales bacterium]|nr:ferrochelatase [Myxococcales bacterium]
MNVQDTGLLVLHFGGPQNVSEVEPFLYQLFSDKDCIKLPLSPVLQKPFAKTISKRRAPETAAQYAEIGGGSPLVSRTFEQVDALRQMLLKEGITLPIAVGMRYTPPFIEQAVRELKEKKVKKIIMLALYPHYSIATSGSAFNEAVRAIDALSYHDVRITVVPAWPTEPDYIWAMADLLRRGLSRFPTGADVHVLFSAHGLPTSYVKDGDPYPNHIQQTIAAVMQILGPATPTYTLAYQSRVGPARWLSPSTDDELIRLGCAGVRNLLVVPVSFVCDHIETLYEIAVTYRTLAQTWGIDRFEQTDALNCHPQFISALKNIVIRALNQAGRRCVRCLLPRPPLIEFQKKCVDCGFREPEFVKWQIRYQGEGAGAIAGKE